jgi:hypothetical protein
MKKSTGASAKALRADAGVPAAARDTRDSFTNFEARIGHGTGNLASGGDRFKSRPRSRPRRRRNW